MNGAQARYDADPAAVAPWRDVEAHLTQARLQFTRRGRRGGRGWRR